MNDSEFLATSHYMISMLWPRPHVSRRDFLGIFRNKPSRKIEKRSGPLYIRRDLFYLLDYITHRSEKSRFEKKIGSDTNWWEISKFRHTFIPLKNVMLLVCQILNICKLWSVVWSKNSHLQILLKFRKLQYFTIYFTTSFFFFFFFFLQPPIWKISLGVT